jgi:hypothetical protein
MDLKMIALYGLAGFGAYALYEKMTAEKEAPMSEFRGTGWQQSGRAGTPWQKYNEFRGTGWQQAGRAGTDWQRYKEFTGTKWQKAGRNRETMWQTGNVFQNACGSCAA